MWIYSSIGRKSLFGSIYSFSTTITVLMIAGIIAYNLIMKGDLRMIKIKIISTKMVLVCTLIVISFFGINNDVLLLFLNWVEYIDEEMLDAFEEKYGITVNMSLGELNEILYSKVSSGTNVYDVVCPSDYMIEKLYYNGYLEKLDYKKIRNNV